MGIRISAAVAGAAASAMTVAMLVSKDCVLTLLAPEGRPVIGRDSWRGYPSSPRNGVTPLQRWIENAGRSRNFPITSDYPGAPTPTIPSGLPAPAESSYPWAWSTRRLERLKQLDPKGWRERQERPRREARHAKRIVELWNKRAQAGQSANWCAASYPASAQAQARRSARGLFPLSARPQ
jgi:hypothetical protein